MDKWFMVLNLGAFAGNLLLFFIFGRWFVLAMGLFNLGIVVFLWSSHRRDRRAAGLMNWEKANPASLPVWWVWALIELLEQSGQAQADFAEEKVAAKMASMRRNRWTRLYYRVKHNYPKAWLPWNWRKGGWV